MTWGLQWRYPGIFRRHEDTRAVVVEVFNIVQMWSFLESGYHTLSQKDKARLAARVAPAVKQVRFDGFEAKSENEHLGVARFLIEHIDRFPEFKGRDLDAGGPTLETHRRMLAMFEPMRRNLMGRHLTPDDIINIQLGPYEILEPLGAGGIGWSSLATTVQPTPSSRPCVARSTGQATTTIWVGTEAVSR